MKAFVTGGTGFIGSHLVDHLIDSEHYEEVRCLVRSHEKWLENRTYTRINGDLHDPESLKRGTQNADIIFHLAGIVKAKSWRQFYDGNVETAENLLKAARYNGVSKIVILSSLAAAGPSQDDPKTEHDPMTPVSMYGESKKQMEKRVHEIAREDTETVTILRPAAVYGPRDQDIYTIFKLADFGICPIVGDGVHPKISMIYVGDVIRSIMQASKRSETGVRTYFVADEPIYTWNRVRQTLAEVMDRRTIPIYLRPRWVKGIASFIETSASLFNSYPILNRDKANELVLEWTCSTQRIKDELGFECKTSLKEGFAQTVRWYKRHHWL